MCVTICGQRHAAAVSHSNVLIVETLRLLLEVLTTQLGGQMF
jgi:hypothetical protein